MICSLERVTSLPILHRTGQITIKLIKEIRTTADFSKRVDLMHQAEDMLMDTGAK